MKVIFDTNAAREYIAEIPHTNIENHSKSNAEKMKHSNIELLINPIVIMELMYHLLDKNDKHYYVSYNTIKALILTMEYQHKLEDFPMMAVAECIIARELFNKRIEQREEMYMRLMSAATDIAHKNIDNIENFVSTNGATIKEYVDNVEDSFVEQIKMIINNINTNPLNIKFSDYIKSDRYEQMLATYIIRTTYTLLINENKIDSQTSQLIHLLSINCQSLDYQKYKTLLSAHPELIMFLEKFMDHSQIIIKKYPSFIALFKQVIIKVRNGMSDEKIRNYIWDILLMFNVTNLTIDKDPVVFITSDKEMLEAANISHKNLSIMTFIEFKTKYLQ